MTKSDFEKLINESITSIGYEKIETVYMYHPCINNKANGKEEIAHLYNKYGWIIINDMYPRAALIKDLQNRIRKLEDELSEALRPDNQLLES